MFGLSSISNKNKKAKYNRFQYIPKEYDEVKEDIKLRRAEARDRVNGKDFTPAFTRPKKKKLAILNVQTAFLLVELFFIVEAYLSIDDRGHFGEYSNAISIGGIITFAYFFIRFNKR
jgi:hypothetical protein